LIEITGGTLGAAAGLTGTLDTRFRQAGGVLGGAGTLVLAGGIDIAAGASDGFGTGTTVLKGVSTIEAFAALAFDGGHVVENEGSLTWQGGSSSIIRLGAYSNNVGATIRNDAGAVFAITGDSNYGIVTSAGTDSFVNAGTLIKSGGTGVNTIGVSLVNTGTVSAGSGILNLSGGGTSSGVLTAAKGATLDINAGQLIVSGISASAGSVANGGIIEISGSGDIEGDSFGSLDTKFLQSGGTIGGTGTLVLAKGLEFFNVGIDRELGTGTTLLKGTSTIDAGASLAFDSGHTLENAGTLIMEAGHSIIRMGAYGNNTGATIRNDLGAVFNITGYSTYGIVASAGNDSFVNAGTLLKSGDTGAIDIGVALINSGTVTATAGTLDLTGGGTSTGVLTAAKGGIVDVSGGTLIDSGTSASAGTIANGGLVEISGSGNFEVASSASLDTKFLQAGGTISGIGTLVLAKGIEFASGGNDLELGTGTTLLRGSSTIDGGAAVALDSGRTLENAGTLTWDGGHNIIRLGIYGNNTGATLRNDAGAVFDIVGISTYGFSVGGSGTDSLVNAGLLETTGAATGQTLIPIAVTNTATGTISVLSGSLELSAVNTLAGTLNGNKTLTLAGASSFGGLTIGGSLVVLNETTITQTGTVILGDATTAATTLLNQTGMVYDIAADADIGVGAAAGSSFKNLGTLAKISGTGTSAIAASVVDTGTVTIASGMLQFDGANSSFAGPISGAGTLGFGGGTSTVKAGTSITTSALVLSGASTSLVLAENLTYAGSLTETGGTLAAGAAALTLTGTDTIAGTVGGTGVLTLGGRTTLAAGANLGIARLTLAAGSMTTVTGNLTYAGTLTEATTAGLTIAGGGGLTLSANESLFGPVTIAHGGTLGNAATLSTSGTLIDAGIIDNTGHLNDATPLTVGGGTVLNAGVINSTVKSGGIGIALSGSGMLTNVSSGLIEAASASVEVVQVAGPASVVNSGTILATGSAAIALDFATGSGTLTNSGTLSATGAAGAAISAQGTAAIVNNLGGLISGTVGVTSGTAAIVALTNYGTIKSRQRFRRAGEWRWRHARSCRHVRRTDRARHQLRLVRAGRPSGGRQLGLYRRQHDRKHYSLRRRGHAGGQWFTGAVGNVDHRRHIVRHRYTDTRRRHDRAECRNRADGRRPQRHRRHDDAGREPDVCRQLQPERRYDRFGNAWADSERCRSLHRRYHRRQRHPGVARHGEPLGIDAERRRRLADLRDGERTRFAGLGRHRQSRPRNRQRLRHHRQRRCGAGVRRHRQHCQRGTVREDRWDRHQHRRGGHVEHRHDRGHDRRARLHGRQQQLRRYHQRCRHARTGRRQEHACQRRQAFDRRHPAARRRHLADTGREPELRRQIHGIVRCHAGPGCQHADAQWHLRHRRDDFRHRHAGADRGHHRARFGNRVDGLARAGFRRHDDARRERHRRRRVRRKRRRHCAHHRCSGAQWRCRVDGRHHRRYRLSPDQGRDQPDEPDVRRRRHMAGIRDRDRGG
jgi:hypothetical protein